MVDETVTNKKVKGGLFLKYFSVALAILVIIILIIVKYNDPEFPSGVVFFVILVAVVFTIFVIWGSNIFALFKNKGNAQNGSTQPEPISDEACYEMVEEAMRHPRYADRIGSIHEDGSESVGDKIKSDVYTLYFTGTKKPIKQYAYIINKHFPDKKKKVLVNPSSAYIRSTKNNLATSPAEPADVEETTIENPMTGNRMTTKKTSHKKNKDEEKKAEELV